MLTKRKIEFYFVLILSFFFSVFITSTQLLQHENNLDYLICFGVFAIAPLTISIFIFSQNNAAKYLLNEAKEWKSFFFMFSLEEVKEIEKKIEKSILYYS